VPDFNFDAIMAKLAGVAGALFSMQFLKGTFRERLTSALTGAAFAYYASDFVSAKIGLPTGLTGFLLGFFGMAVVSKAWEWFQTAPLGEWATQAGGAFVDKWFPKKPTDTRNQDGK